MRKFITTVFVFSLLSIAGLGFILTGQAAAVNILDGVCSNAPLTNDGSGAASRPDICEDNRTNGSNPIYGADGILTSVIKILSYVVGIIAVLTLIIAGLKLITSGGDSSGVSTARRAVLYAVIGLLFAAISQVVILYVLNRL